MQSAIHNRPFAARLASLAGLVEFSGKIARSGRKSLESGTGKCLRAAFEAFIVLTSITMLHKSNVQIGTRLSAHR